MNIMYIGPIFIVVFVVGYYVYYFKIVKAAGGLNQFAEQQRKAAYEQIKTLFHVRPGETVVEHYIGQHYMGPLVPESELGAAKQIWGFVSNTTYVAAKIRIGFTNLGRMLILQQQDTDEHYAPLMAVDPEGTRPQLVYARDAFPNHPKLPKPNDAPVLTSTLYIPPARTELVQLVFEEDHAPLTFWCEIAGIDAIRRWSSQG